LRSFWLGLIGVLAIVYAANSMVDVSGLDSYDAIYRLSKAQTSRDILVWDQYFDQRPWLEAKLDDARHCPDTLILGSSTVGTIAADGEHAESIINGWLTNGGIEELEAATAIMDRSGCRPQKIVLGVDPWLFNVAQTSESWRSLSSDVFAFRRAHGDFGAFDLLLQSVEQRWQTFKERLNYSSTLATARFVLRRVRQKLAWQATLVRMNPDAYCDSVKRPPWIRAADGHYHICTKLRGITPATALEEAEAYVARNTRSIADWERIDPERLRRLERVLGVWRSWQRDVVLVAPPLHPIAYQKVTAVPKLSMLLHDMDAALERACRSAGAAYVNLRDPAVLGCTVDQFRDGHHSDSRCSGKVLSASMQALASMRAGASP
jgi:hypothetical protein